MSQKKIVVSVAADGDVKIDAQGFTGSACSLATRSLEMVLAGNDMSNVKDDKKPDFFARVSPSATHKN